MTRRIVFFGLFFALLLAAGAAWSARTVQARVAWVTDGDTVVLTQDHQRIRLSDIDAPETSHAPNQRNQPYGQQSKAYLTRLIDNQVITLKVHSTDQYGRWIATIYHNGNDINLAMVRAGLAWQYKRYSKRRDMAQAMQSAQHQHKGLWGDDNPIPPWVWRHKGLATRR